MRPKTRTTLLLGTALVLGLASCGGDPTGTGSDGGRRRMEIPAPAMSDDSTACMSGYNVSNGIVTCT